MDTTKTPRRSSSATVPKLKPTISTSSLPESRSFRRSPSPQQQTVTRSSRSATSSPRPSIERSSSVLKHRTTPTKKLLPSISTTPKIPLPTTTPDHDVRRPSPIRRVRSTLTGSPSAWALSPGRTLLPSLSSPSSSLTLSPSLVSSSSSSSSSKARSLWRYFQRQKRASPEDERGFHDYRLMYNRLLQWRFANAKSEASLAIINKKSEERLFAVWLKVCKMRNSIVEKRSRVQRLRLKIKLLGIICPQLQLLDAWEVMEKRNTETVARVARKLSAYSMKLPIVNGAKVDIIDLYEAMRFGLEVLQDIEIHVTKFLTKAEGICDVLTEIIGTMGEHDKCFQELEKTITTIMSLEAEETSLRANVIQVNQEMWETQNSCKFHRFISSFPTSRGGVFSPLYSLLNVS